MISVAYSAGLFGIDGYLVTVECHMTSSLSCFEIVGLPDNAIKEAKERVRASLINSRLPFPQKEIIVNLAPADKRKEGPLYDLPIFVAILKASGQLRAETDGSAFIGELSLDGLVRRVNGALPMVIRAKNSGLKRVFVPALYSKASKPLSSAGLLSARVKSLFSGSLKNGSANIALL